MSPQNDNAVSSQCLTMSPHNANAVSSQCLTMSPHNANAVSSQCPPGVTSRLRCMPIDDSSGGFETSSLIAQWQCFSSTHGAMQGTARLERQGTARLGPPGWRAQQRGPTEPQKVVVGTARAGGSLPAGHTKHVVDSSTAEYLPAITLPRRQHTLSSPRAHAATSKGACTR